jgi:hypothetical protein
LNDCGVAFEDGSLYFSKRGEKDNYKCRYIMYHIGYDEDSEYKNFNWLTTKPPPL